MARGRWHELCKLVEKDDGLRTWEEARSWTREKLYFWYRYLEITSDALVGRDKWPIEIAYVDLFAGASVCTLKDSKERIPGSVLIAANMNKPFSRIIACEAVPESANACKARLDKTLVGNRCHVLTGDCNERVREIVELIPHDALTLAFIDPTGLDAKFATLAALSRGRRVDLVILFADAYDIPRNVEQHYRKDSNSKLDQVLGHESRWREQLDALLNPTPENKRKLFRKIYEEQLRRRLGYKYFSDKPIQGPRGHIYTLIYASKHKLGLKFWNEAVSKEASGQLNLKFPD